MARAATARAPRTVVVAAVGVVAALLLVGWLGDLLPSLGNPFRTERVDRTSPTLLQALDDLSERELDVLRLIALGHTNAEIGEQLFLSMRTVETHRSHIQHKLRRTTRAELVRYALDHGLMDA